MLLLEIGNSTIKLASYENGKLGVPERYDALPAALSRIGAADGPVLCAPVGRTLSDRVFEALEDHVELVVIGRDALAAFVDESYDTPDTLGIDRVLNLLGLDGDGIVISCGTAITVDAKRAERPLWGAIMPGFRTAADGLHTRVPVLPLVDETSLVRLPARTSTESVANGVLLGSTRGARALALELADAAGVAGRDIVLTGGDAEILAGLWGENPPRIDQSIIFRGMLRAAGVAADS